MPDEKALKHAFVRFRGFRSHVFGSITETIVDEYHEILSSLQKSSGDDLAMFFIPPSKMLARGVPPVSHKNLRYPTYSRFDPQFTTLKYCDEKFFREKMERLWDHFAKAGIH
ncbi:MAG TPA: hypothetical protein VGI45_05545 [Terracidiphilus sp.]|jgi:hypothetical protein